MQKITLICDHCGIEGHDPKEPSKECIAALKKRITDLSPSPASLLRDAIMPSENLKQSDHLPPLPDPLASK